jgi:hypothetical protein
MYDGYGGTGGTTVQHYSTGYNVWSGNLVPNEWEYTCASDLNWAGNSFDGEINGNLAYNNQQFRAGDHVGTGNAFQWRFNGHPENQTSYYDRVWGTTSDEVKNFFKDPQTLLIGSLETFTQYNATPQNVTQPAGLTPYNATHSITDVTGMVIDLGVEVGINFISLVGVIAIIGLFVWIRPRIGDLL